jgi:hypothetical protein
VTTDPGAIRLARGEMACEWGRTFEAQLDACDEPARHLLVSVWPFPLGDYRFCPFHFSLALNEAASGAGI